MLNLNSAIDSVNNAHVIFVRCCCAVSFSQSACWQARPTLHVVSLLTVDVTNEIDISISLGFCLVWGPSKTKHQ